MFYLSYAGSYCLLVIGSRHCKDNMVPKLITLEEHFICTEIDGTARPYEAFGGGLVSRLQSLDSKRIKDMDNGCVDIQVISHAPLSTNAENCSRGNNQLAEACKRHPHRLFGFAMLPMLEPEEAARELERAVVELGFLGALINNHSEGSFYDDEKYWVVFEKAIELDVPVYLHPNFPSPEMAEHYKGNFSNIAAFVMSMAAWGWHSETGLHILRLFAAGLFDKLPKLKLVIGHDGEMLPFMLERILPLSKAWGERERDLKAVWEENIWVTTSAMFSQSPLACLLRVSKIDRILYSVDYPLHSNEEGLDFVKGLQESDLVNDEQWEKICHGNAEKLLKLKIGS